MFSNG